MNDGADRSGTTVVVEGLALPGRAGALVQADDGTPYYVGGLETWDDALMMKRVSVTGVLRIREPTVQRLPPEEEQSTGLPGRTFVIDDASWSLAGGP
jgi:hypothetical protein